MGKVSKRYNSFLKIICFNGLFLITGIFFIEFFFRVLEKKPLIIQSKYLIPKIKCNLKTRYEISHIYKLKNSLKSYYVRNKECYRSYQKNSNLEKILTIGGSTTDQIYVTEGKTFQDLLDIKFQNKFDFINGGIDGQSSLGHLFSLQNWHSKALDNQKIKEVIFYIGINDRSLFGENKRFFFKYNLKRRLLDLLESNSKLYKLTKNIYKSKKIPKDFDPLAAHTGKFEFTNTNKISLINPEIISENYEEGFKKLILTTINLFPYSSIKIIQQQIPGCKFIEEKIVIDRHGENSEICQQLGSVYLSMDNVVDNLSEYNKSKISVHKMFLRNIIKDEDVYDSVHTKDSGSKKIAEYIYSLY